MLLLLSRKNFPNPLGFGGSSPPPWWSSPSTSMVAPSLSFESTFFSIPLPSHSFTITKLLTGISLSQPLPTIKLSFLLLRPPPEPPPPRRNDKLVVHTSNTTTMDASLFQVAAHTIPLYEICRPPPKPPWLYSMKFLTEMVNFGFLIYVLCFCVLVVNDALLVFDKMPQKSFVSCNMFMCVYWHLIVIEEAYEFNIYSTTIFSHLLICEHSKNWGNFETKESRNVQTQVKEIILNWIWKKTMDSHFYIAIDGVCKRVDCLLICCWFWFGCALPFEISMYNVSYDYVMFYVRSAFRLCMEYVPFQLSRNICNSCLIEY